MRSYCYMPFHIHEQKKRNQLGCISEVFYIKKNMMEKYIKKEDKWIQQKNTKKIIKNIMNFFLNNVVLTSRFFTKNFSIIVVKTLTLKMLCLEMKGGEEWEEFEWNCSWALGDLIVRVWTEVQGPSARQTKYLIWVSPSFGDGN